MKGIGLIVLGLLIGLGLAISFNQDFESEQRRLAPVGGGSIEEIDALRAHVDQQIAAIDQRLSMLGSAVDDLSGQLASIGTPPDETPTVDRSDPSLWRGTPTAPFNRARQFGGQQDDSDRILAAGFTQDRIDWLDRRVEELQMEARRAPDAGGTGESIEIDPLLPIPTQAMMSMIEPHSLLRPEIGDDEYERYLQAKGGERQWNFPKFLPVRRLSRVDCLRVMRS